MEKYYGIAEIARRAGLAVSTVWSHMSDETCPLRGATLKERLTRRTVATRETVDAYLRWLKQPVSKAKVSK